ncbi:MAG: lipopolysaccharide heptosyltransferase family protein [Desulfobacteraceae bacterium]|nr:MAG: lipopolysaccharide heptosyltransferase family protein [Desulfobacteraceae bacterium]
MRFMAVNRPVKAEIFGESFSLRALDAPDFGAVDILVSDDGTASELLKKHSPVLVEASFDSSALPRFPRKPPSIECISSSSKVVVLRAGGVGDHVMFLPALTLFREALPKTAKLFLATQKEKHPIFRSHRCIDGLMPLPLTLAQLVEADYVVDFSESLQSPDFNSMNLTDYFLKRFGIDNGGCANKAPRLLLPCSGGTSKVCKAMDRLRKRVRSERIVLLQGRSSNPLRDLPEELLTHVAESFPDIGFVSPDAFSALHSDAVRLRNIEDMSPWVSSLEEYMNLVASCDAVVSTDTAAYHLAEAFGIPSLALFGPISSDLRIRYYRKAQAIDASYTGKTCIAPCGLHKSFSGCPEAKALGSAHSPCLLSIEPEQIRKAFSLMCRRFWI